jgi:Fe-S oxidoreductase
MCPVGSATRLETYTPHAWALTIESVERGQLSWNAETADVMYACADCGMCRTHCVTDQPLPDAVAAARARIVDAGAAPLRVYELQRMFERYANVYAPVMPAASLPVRTGVALWVGDAAQYLQPAVVAAAVKLLKSAGIDATPIGAGRSSGWLAASLGLRDTARDLARAAVAEVEASGAAEVLVLSTADAWAFGHVYGARLDVTWPARVIVKDTTAVLAESASAGALTFKAKSTSSTYAFHDACHAPRVMRNSAAPRILLKAAFGESGARELFWREDRAQPCGAIGGLEFTHPDISSLMAAARWADAKAAGAMRLVSDDPACCHHLSEHSEAGMKVENLFVVLAECV